MAGWTQAAMPDQSGRVAVVTGASSGIGAAAAEMLAAKGGDVVLAVRDAARGEAVRTRILARNPGARVRVSLLDLADLGSVRAFASRIEGEVARVDVLLNNAGLGMQPQRGVTADGFERQFGTNHLGHFALTGLLLPALLRAQAARVVGIASLAHRRARIDFSDLMGERRYRGGAAYGQSKLANLMFAFELDRRARAAGAGLVSVAAHPGLSRTGFMAASQIPAAAQAAVGVLLRVAGQDEVRGALPGVYAATMPGVEGGSYWGPDGVLEARGTPKRAVVARQAMLRGDWARLWAASEALTGVTYSALG
jgi:NAD(P)-dependent dehydrogenase (short-subunit alcohol dehydrogenase family)